MFTKKRPQPRSLRTGTRELPRYASKSAVSKSVQTFSHSPFPLSPIYSLFLFFLIYAYLGKHGDGVWCGPPQETLNTGLPMVDLIRCCMRYFVFFISNISFGSLSFYLIFGTNRVQLYFPPYSPRSALPPSALALGCTWTFMYPITTVTGMIHLPIMG